MANVDDAITRVLLVEDDERLAQLVARYLERHGLAVAVCNSGRTAISDALRVAYDCVVLDAQSDLLAVCRDVRRVSNAAIVLISYSSDMDPLSAAADDLVPMPFSPRDLLGRISANVLRARQRANFER